ISSNFAVGIRILLIEEKQQEALEEIGHEGYEAPFPSQHAPDVGGADVAAAMLPDVDSSCFANQVARRDRSHQVEQRKRPEPLRLPMPPLPIGLFHVVHMFNRT